MGCVPFPSRGFWLRRRSSPYTSASAITSNTSTCGGTREDEAWLRFLPLTAALTAAGLFVEKRLNEGSPLRQERCSSAGRVRSICSSFSTFSSRNSAVCEAPTRAQACRWAIR
ncbi:MAG: hypothetical protein M0C28_34165 [Candidatus Moduliflexus flocculans]|nr:hypothetical protein [Candidatus Moduliflexus flocculans]